MREFIKNWDDRKANILTTIIEFIILGLYFSTGNDFFMKGVSAGNVVGMYDEVWREMLLFTLLFLIFAIVCLSVRSMRTAYTARLSVWNVIWSVGNFYVLFG